MVVPKHTLQIKVLNATVPPAKNGGRADPYVVIKVGNKKVKGKALHKTTQPDFNQNLTLTFPSTEPKKESLSIAIFHHKSVGSDLKLGTAEVSLDGFVKGEPITHSYPIKTSSHGTDQPYYIRLTLTAVTFDSTLEDHIEKKESPLQYAPPAQQQHGFPPSAPPTSLPTSPGVYVDGVQIFQPLGRENFGSEEEYRDYLYALSVAQDAGSAPPPNVSPPPPPPSGFTHVTARVESPQPAPHPAYAYAYPPPNTPPQYQTAYPYTAQPIYTSAHPAYVTAQPVYTAQPAYATTVPPERVEELRAEARKEKKKKQRNRVLTILAGVGMGVLLVLSICLVGAAISNV